MAQKIISLCIDEIRRSLIVIRAGYPEVFAKEPTADGWIVGRKRIRIGSRLQRRIFREWECTSAYYTSIDKSWGGV
jgi:hypothetical protein